MAKASYPYDPKLAPAVVLAIFFGLSMLWHFFQLIRHKTWYFLPFIIGVIFEVVGLGCRAINASETPDWSFVPFALQTLLILLAPALFAAAMYMVLGRLIRSLNAKHLSVIRATWMTKIFVLGDIISFIAQALGAAIITNAETKSRMNLGKNIILIGLFVQILFFVGFVVIMAIFHFRLSRRPTTVSLESVLPWNEYLFAMYGASFLIMLRSVFRVIEFAIEGENKLKTSEVFLYVLDVSPMLSTSYIFNGWHPSRVIKKSLYKPSSVHTELLPN